MSATIASSVPAHMTSDEWALRCDLASLYRLVAHFGMTDLVYTHISARVPGPEDHFLINRYGVLFQNMLPSTLVRIDCDGRIVHPQEGDETAINPAGFVIHSAIHMARPEFGCIIHTHTAAGAAVAAQRQGLLPISQQALKFRGHIGYHDYEGIALDLGERERLVDDLGMHKAMILRNHGLLAAGRTIPEAFSTIYLLETACRIQIAAQSGGAELTIPSEEVCRHTADQYNRDGGDLEHYEFLWRSMLPLIGE
ncbi:class II aldolase/adducin family protein [Novosphingobium sp. H3SJ31-1]|uniref:Class II aldolase/adducin family protein n=2 Tax=Novosphingobium album (ex Liu et al. 2023) TaxID=3031130 RepID=A0ABT5WXH2_9SPHN|nr:class II aldolase/adducin family protein [Novosphingobium album (ex Liu et al. 2023)]MDE8654605.1 class II aldolase/adducin family protein [Novosphingobium album (ex Liu et al. 2023)]